MGNKFILCTLEFKLIFIVKYLLIQINYQFIARNTSLVPLQGSLAPRGQATVIGYEMHRDKVRTIIPGQDYIILLKSRI